MAWRSSGSRRRIGCAAAALASPSPPLGATVVSALIPDSFLVLSTKRSSSQCLRLRSLQPVPWHLAVPAQYFPTCRLEVEPRVRDFIEFELRRRLVSCAPRSQRPENGGFDQFPSCHGAAGDDCTIRFNRDKCCAAHFEDALRRLAVPVACLLPLADAVGDPGVGHRPTYPVSPHRRPLEVDLNFQLRPKKVAALLPVPLQLDCRDKAQGPLRNPLHLSAQLPFIAEL